MQKNINSMNETTRLATLDKVSTGFGWDRRDVVASVSTISKP